MGWHMGMTVLSCQAEHSSSTLNNEAATKDNAVENCSQGVAKLLPGGELIGDRRVKPSRALLVVRAV